MIKIKELDGADQLAVAEEIIASQPRCDVILLVKDNAIYTNNPDPTYIFIVGALFGMKLAHAKAK